MKFSNKIAWMFFVSQRFSRVDRRGRSALTAYLSSLGIAFGVMTLIVVMAVMNGFQLGYIESILEISSFHARATVLNSTDADLFENLAKKQSGLRSATPFFESQALVVGNQSRQQASLLRFIPMHMYDTDAGFSSQITMHAGSFDVSGNKTVIGYSLARALGVSIGDTINILAMSGSSDVDLFSDSRIYEVSGIFSSSYSEINSTFMFFSLEAANAMLGQSFIPMYGIKLHNSDADYNFLARMQESLILNNLENTVTLESWRSYNRSFFGALRVEKILLMLLVFMIFIVVGVNIYNSMRRMVFERREDIAVLSALGSTPSSIQTLFIFRGFFIGLTGALFGLLFGILISENMDKVFIAISKTIYFVQYFFVMIFNNENLYIVTENPMFSFYAKIPTRMETIETTIIAVFGLLSALCSSWIASRRVLKLFAAEVLRYE